MASVSGMVARQRDFHLDPSLSARVPSTTLSPTCVLLRSNTTKSWEERVLCIAIISSFVSYVFNYLSFLFDYSVLNSSATFDDSLISLVNFCGYFLFTDLLSLSFSVTQKEIGIDVHAH